MALPTSDEFDAELNTKVSLGERARKIKEMKDVNKTVKHCEVCQENFGDRFSFCPVCGEPLKAVEVGQNEAFAAAPTRDSAQLQSEQIAAATSAPIIESAPQFVRQPTVASTNGASKFQDNQKILPEEENIVNTSSEINQSFVEEESFQSPIEEVKSLQQPIEAAKDSSQPVIKQPPVETFRIKPPIIEEPVFTRNIAARPVSEETTNFADKAAAGDGMYHLTMLQTPPTYRRYLGYGAMFGLFMLLTSGIVMLIVGIYSYNVDIESPEFAQDLYAVAIDEADPVQIEKVIPQKNKDNGGGGGGGGRKDPKPASEGAPAPQRPDPPIVTPSVNIPRLDNPAIKIQASTQGPVVTKRVEDQPYGIHGGGYDPSDGQGRGLGQGNGNGTGQGNGVGSGRGNGNGSGIGNGNGNGYGNGRGSGTGDEAPPAPVAAVTEKLNIISKPRANYTEEARKNQVSGTVRVRVTFSSSGQVTGVTAIGGLPYGLTEQAIAAARQIKFTPEKHGGQAVSVNKVIEYNFNLY